MRTNSRRPKRKPHPKAAPSLLLAIMVGARKVGDAALERVCARELREDHGLDVRFVEAVPA